MDCFRLLLVSAGLAATWSGPVTAFSFSLVPTTGVVYSGWFDAEDSNDDNWIDTSEVLSFRLNYVSDETGGAGTYGVFADSSAGGFLDLHYNIDGSIGDEAQEFLRFGRSREVPCTLYGATPTDSTATETVQATLNGLFSTAPPPHGDQFDPARSCAEIGGTLFPIGTFARQTLIVEGPVAVAGPLPPVSPVPLPGGLPMIGTCALLLAALSRRTSRRRVA